MSQHRSLWVALAALCACTGDVQPVVTADAAAELGGGGKDSGALRDLFVREASAADSGSPKKDGAGALPTKGEPCPSSQCAGDLICFAGFCRTVCTQPNLACNNKVAACADDEFCRPASSFSEVCWPAGSNVGETCGSQSPCVGGTMCVSSGGPATCRALCNPSVGCGGGKPCAKTSNGCLICL